MSVSRRSFLTTLGAGGAGVLAAPLITGRGSEAAWAQASSRRADRLLAARPGMIRIDSNENPNGPGERVYAAIRRHLNESNRYPVQSEDDLAAAIARTHAILPENVILGCGSGELLRGAVSAFTAPDHPLVSPEPTFEAPAAWARFLGMPVRTPRVDPALRLDLDAMTAAGRGAGLVYLCNPNNPTGTVLGAAAVSAYVARMGQLSPETTVLIDEAYHEYVDDPSYRTAIPLALANYRVVVTRTFSKVFGMAGLRIGYAVGQPATLAKLAAWLLGSNVSQLSLVAATVAVGDTPHIALEQRRNRETRAYTGAAFENAGYPAAGADANFLMVDIRRDAKDFKLECLKRKVAVGRQFLSHPNLVRVSIGTAREMKRALPAMLAVLGQSPAA